MGGGPHRLGCYPQPGFTFSAAPHTPMHLQSMRLQRTACTAMHFSPPSNRRRTGTMMRSQSRMLWLAWPVLASRTAFVQFFTCRGGKACRQQGGGRSLCVQVRWAGNGSPRLAMLWRQLRAR